MKILIKHLCQAFDLSSDLVQGLRDDDLKLRLKDLPSNTIGEQFWCIIGARESYTKAIINEGWLGFSCSLQSTKSKDRVIECLEKSAAKSLDYLDGRQLTEVQLEYVIALLEHEIQHHGQLIRYVYGNKLAFPKSWNNRYTV